MAIMETIGKPVYGEIDEKNLGEAIKNNFLGEESNVVDNGDGTFSVVLGDNKVYVVDENRTVKKEELRKK